MICAPYRRPTLAKKPATVIRRGLQGIRKQLCYLFPDVHISARSTRGHTQNRL